MPAMQCLLFDFSVTLSNILTKSILFFSTTKTSKTKFLSFSSAYESFFVIQQKFPRKIRFLIYTLFKHKKKESDVQSLVKLKIHCVSSFCALYYSMKR